MAHMGGLTLEAKLAEMGADIPIVFISGHGDISMAVNAIKRGAVDFVPKPYQEQHLLDAVNEALRRDVLRRGDPINASGPAERLQTLTSREREVLDLAMEGQSSKAIAQKLGISHRTVERHRSRLLEKLGVASVTELLRLKFGNEA